jgi:tRNA/tmRNA/rRNA uracil-C5-methylase (TrmA/RlmC/RlmD family)
MTFSQLLLDRLPNSPYGSEPLANLLYSQELQLKNQAFAELWAQAKLEGRPEAITPAPMPRKYRTTTKRRVVYNEQRGLSLDFADRGAPGTCAFSNLEPDNHNSLYEYLFDRLSTPAYVALARALNWIIIRGGYTSHCVILNVSKLDATVVRKAKQLTEKLPELNFGVTSAMIYFDPTRSDYYLEAERPDDGLDAKHLFGPRLLTLAVEDLKLKYPPTVFSQVNEAMVPLMVQTAREMLDVKSSDRLLDLYCGYGLFSFALGRKAKEVLGVELEGASIATAKDSVRFLGLGSKFRFVSARITGEMLVMSLPPVSPTLTEVILLDPPRQGADPGVIKVLAQRKPRRVLQICCGTDEIAPAVRDWVASGYKVDRICPLDLFAGTANLETLISFVPR